MRLEHYRKVLVVRLDAEKYRNVYRYGGREKMDGGEFDIPHLSRK